MNITNISFKAITHEEHIDELRKEVSKKGLYKAVKKRCDVIDSEAYILPYVPYAVVQENLIDILALIKLSEEEQNGKKIHH